LFLFRKRKENRLEAKGGGINSLGMKQRVLRKSFNEDANFL
jgi:hypothetical protein